MCRSGDSEGSQCLYEQISTTGRLALDAKRGRTLAHLRLALPARLQLVKGVDHGENLHRTDGGEHVRIVAGRRPKTTGFVLA